VAETLISGPRLRAADGRVLPLDVGRWLAPANATDHDLLDRARGPVIDVGCGPGRHVRALLERGIEAVGVDVSPDAVALARRRGARVWQRSVFDTLPRAGHWGSALLLDGSVGIGGDPQALFCRLGQLLSRRGRLLVEAEGPEVQSETLLVRLERRRAQSPWFRWARLSVTDASAVAARAGFCVTERWESGGRYFARLEPAGAAT
jgi:SAM-dependent methyltransferase